MMFRYNVSPAAAAAICSSFLLDLTAAGHLAPQLSYLACDPSKLQRARTAEMNTAKIKDKSKVALQGISGIHFDGRRDKTMTMIPDSRGQLHHRIIREEHISVTSEPEGTYLAHFTPEEPLHPEKPAFKEEQGLYDILCSHGATESCLVLGEILLPVILVIKVVF